MKIPAKLRRDVLKTMEKWYLFPFFPFLKRLRGDKVIGRCGNLFRLSNLGLSSWQKSDSFGSIAEGNIETLKDIFSSYKVETDSQARGKTNGGLKENGANFNGKIMQIHRDKASVPNSYIDFFAFLIGYPCPYSVLNRKNREGCAGIYVAFGSNPNFFSGILNFYRNDGAIEGIGKGYRLHNSIDNRSSFLGTGIPMGETLNFLLNSFSTSVILDSVAGKTLPFAIRTYSPPCLLINFEKLLRNHSWSSIFFILITSNKKHTILLKLSQEIPIIQFPIIQSGLGFSVTLGVCALVDTRGVPHKVGTSNGTVYEVIFTDKNPGRESGTRELGRSPGGPPYSNTTVYSELNGLIGAGILEIVDKNTKPYNYKLKEQLKEAKAEIEKILQKLSIGGLSQKHLRKGGEKR